MGIKDINHNGIKHRCYYEKRHYVINTLYLINSLTSLQNSLIQR